MDTTWMPTAYASLVAPRQSECPEDLLGSLPISNSNFVIPLTSPACGRGAAAAPPAPRQWLSSQTCGSHRPSLVSPRGADGDRADRALRVYSRANISPIPNIEPQYMGRFAELNRLDWSV
eukprot:3732848-Pyramimonas_sp.AAC.3